MRAIIKEQEHEQSYNENSSSYTTTTRTKPILRKDASNHTSTKAVHTSWNTGLELTFIDGFRRRFYAQICKLLQTATDRVLEILLGVDQRIFDDRLHRLDGGVYHRTR